MNGWIKLHRSITDHWIWHDERKLKWWLDILLTVNHDDAKVNIGYEIVECKKGQSVRSLQSWADRWNVSKDSARHFLKLLAKDNMITHESLCKTTRITVCNYDKYQVSTHDEQTKRTRKLNGGQTMPDPNKKDKEGLRINTAFEFYKSEAEKSKSFSDDISKGYLEFARHICKKDKSGEFEMYYFLLVDKPLSLDHYYRLRKKPCDAQEIIDMADQIQNKVDYHYSYTDVYKTFNTWLNRKK